MAFNFPSSEMMLAESYSTSKRDLVDPGLQDFSPSDDWHMRELFEKTGYNSTSSPSPWNIHETYMSSVPFDSFSVTNHQYVPSESSVSLPYSSAGSAYNGVPDWESYRDPSTPGDAAAFSPGNDTDSLYQGEGYMPTLSFTGLENPSTTQQHPACSMYGHEAYSIPSDHGSSSNLQFHNHRSYPSFSQGSGVMAAMTESDVGSPRPSVLSAPNYPAPDALSPAEEKELAFNRKSSPVVSRVTKPPTNKATKATSKPARGQSKVSKPSGKASHNNSGSKSSVSSICIQCSASYKDSAALEKHIKQSHTRPFICVFHYAGCKSTFATKNEWKRHVMSQHLYLNYYHCAHEECATAKPTSSRRRPKNLPQYGGIFNRKDLFTQHVRRMHQPDDKKKKPSRQAEDQIKRLQEHAFNIRCVLPKHMYCPARNCEEQFIGDHAWDERMEHVARHLERAAAGEEEPVRFGGDHDQSLSAWVESPAVDVVRRCYGGWKLNNPIKGGDRSMDGSDGSTFDEDAEGEEC